MRIVCPGCAAAYEVPADRLSPRKMVRCARCGAEWVAVQEADPIGDPAEEPARALDGDSAGSLAAQSQAALPAVTAMDRLAAAGSKPGRSAALLLAWMLSFAALGGMGAAVFTWRGAVVHAWPAAARILGSQTSPATTHAPAEKK